MRKALISGVMILMCCSFPACEMRTESTTKSVSVPAWTKQAVWYQIFPERFHNGDPSNDPQFEDLWGSWPHDLTGPYEVSRWTGDWYARQPWEDPSKDFYYHVQRRRYGGDLQGVLDKLDYLKELGINAIYFNPLFESPSLHKYDGASFHHIDDNFGPNPRRDREIAATEIPHDPKTWKWTAADSLFLKLIAECHRRGIKVVIDGVFNHVGLNFWAFKDVMQNQQRSPFAHWFTIKRWDDRHSSQNEFDYEGWNGVRELPELREDDSGIIAEARDYIIHSVRRWMDPDGDGDPSDGIDGWRLDVAEKVSPAFWRLFREQVKGINPEAYIVGEVWWEDWRSNKMYNARPWLEGDMFDAVMNYRWAKEVVHYFVDHKNRISAAEFDRRLKQLRDDYPADVNYGLMNLLDSHDTDRLASQIINPDDDYDHRDTPRDNPHYTLRKPNAEEIQIQELIALFQMTYLGAPMIYYGDEAGMWGADDPDCRKPMLWPELSYDPEVTHPFNHPRAANENQFNSDLFNHYKKLVHIRRQHPALQVGQFETLLTDDQKDLFIFKRSDANETLIIVINNSNNAQPILIPAEKLDAKPSWSDELTQRTFQVDESYLKVDVPAKTGLVLL